MAYSKKTWNDGEVITKEAMNNIENGVAAANAGIPVNATKAKDGVSAGGSGSKCDKRGV